LQTLRPQLITLTERSWNRVMASAGAHTGFRRE
jgi:hypothetical protein